MPVITPEEATNLSPVFKGRAGRLLFRAGLALTGIGKVNDLYDRVQARGCTPGPDFAKGILDDAGIVFRIGHPERLEALSQGAFITVSNHIYGHLDGICLVDVVGHVRPKAKVLVNQLLTWIKDLTPNFISVEPKTNTTTGVSATSVSGIKAALEQIRGGEPLCLFPSGAVADLKPRDHWRISERDWQDSAIRLIQKARVPVVPIRFPDRNSNFYYALGLIDYRVRFARLFHEVFNKRGTHPRIVIGEPISPEELSLHKDLEDCKSFLRRSVYDMPLPQDYTLRSELWKK